MTNNTLSRAELNNEKGSVRNIHYGDILVKFGEIIDLREDDLPYITDEINSSKTDFLQDGDIIIADTAEDSTVGKCAEVMGISDADVVAGLHTIPCRPRKRYAQGYLGYFMNSSAYHDQLLPLMQGTKVTSVSKSALQETILCFPTDIKEQALIGDYFMRLEDLITLHQRKYAKLVNIKKSMLEKMFPKDGEVVPEIRFAGFTDAWEQRKLSEMCSNFEYGLNAAAKEFDGTNKYIRITDIDDDSRAFSTADITSPDICLDGMTRYLLSNGDIVFARTGASVGKTYIYKENDGIVYFAGFLIRAKVTQENDAEFVFQNTLTSNYEKYIRITSQRSGQPGVNAQEYGEYEFLAPSKEEQAKIGKYLRELDDLITLHQRKLERLQNIKKSCLEKMFV